MIDTRIKPWFAIPAAVLLAVSATTATVLSVGLLEDYDDISSALGEATPGDTIQVAAGTYDASTEIEIGIPRLVLLGEDPATTFLDGEEEAFAVVNVRAPGVVISGFTVRNGSSHGVYLNDTNWAVIDNNVIADNGDRGILLGMGKPWALITSNTFVNNKVSAIYAYLDQPRTKIVNNIIVDNRRGIVTDSGHLQRMTVDYNCFWGQKSDSAQVQVGKGNILAEPMFADTAQRDFHLRSGSPCIGKGENGKTIGAPGLAPPAPRPGPTLSTDRAAFRIVVFSSDTLLGQKVLTSLRNAGFTNGQNYVTTRPNVYANIKYGEPAEALVDTVINLVAGHYQSPLKRESTRSNTDLDIFINLP